MSKVAKISILVLASLSLTACAKTQQEAPIHTGKDVETSYKKNVLSTPKQTNTQKGFSKPFKYNNGKKRFEMLKLDSLNRAQGSHIQLKESQTPKVKRAKRLTIEPSGWHNYKFKANNSRYSWVYNRGHLVGYQFCGVNQAPGNMITQTGYLNQGGLTGMDDKNDKGQLYYENKLRTWLIKHPQNSLDYSVIPIYKGDELVPRQVKLTYVGYNEHGKEIAINLHGLETGDSNNVHSVTLENSTPVANINYETGVATLKNGSNSYNYRHHYHHNKRHYRQHISHLYHTFRSH